MYYIHSVYNDSRAVALGVGVHSRSGKLPLIFYVLTSFVHIRSLILFSSKISVKALIMYIFTSLNTYSVIISRVTRYLCLRSSTYITNGVSHIEKCQQVTLSTHMWTPGLFQLADRNNKKKHDFLSTRPKSGIEWTDSPIFFKSSYC